MVININNVDTRPTIGSNHSYPDAQIAKVNRAIEYYAQSLQLDGKATAYYGSKFAIDNYLYRNNYVWNEWYDWNEDTRVMTPKLGALGAEFNTFSNRTVNIRYLRDGSWNPNITSRIGNRVRLTGSAPNYNIEYQAQNVGTDTITISYQGDRDVPITYTTRVNIIAGTITVSNNKVEFIGGRAIRNTFDITSGNTGTISFETLPSGYSYTLQGNRVTINSTNTSNNRSGTFKLYCMSFGAKSDPVTINYLDINSIETSADNLSMGTNETKTLTITNYSDMLNYSVSVPDQQLFTASISGNTITVRSKTDSQSGLQPSTSGTKNLIINADLR